MEKIKVKVNKASSPSLWYSGCVGATFMLVKPPSSDKELYWTRETAGYINFILKDDAEVVENGNEL